jgi:hypothetical protein
MDLTEKTVDLDASLKSLGEAIDRRMEELDELRDRLHLIAMAALNRIDGDTHADTYWSEIVGIAKGDPNWLRHARINYEVKHARLVQLSARLLQTCLIETDEDLRSPDSIQRVAVAIADQIEQELLPEMQIGEDGRTFLRGQGKPYPVEQA